LNHQIVLGDLDQLISQKIESETRFLKELNIIANN